MKTPQSNHRFKKAHKIGIFRGPFYMHGEIGIPTRFYRILNKCAACFRYIPTTFYAIISALFQSNFRGEVIFLED